MKPGAFYEKVRLDRRTIQQFINQKTLDEPSLEETMNVLFKHFRGKDKAEDRFSFIYQGVGYMMYHDKYARKIYLGSMMELPKDVDAIAV